MLSKRYESTEVERRTWLHVPSGTLWSTSSDTNVNTCIKIIIEMLMTESEACKIEKKFYKRHKYS